MLRVWTNQAISGENKYFEQKDEIAAKENGTMKEIVFLKLQSSFLCMKQVKAVGEGGGGG